MKKISKNIRKFFVLIFFIFSNHSIVFAGDSCIGCKKFREKYSFLVPENYLINNATGNPLTGTEFSPTLHPMSIIGFFISIITIIFGIYNFKKNKKYMVLIFGLLLLIFSLWLKINADYLDACFYYSCDIRSFW
jgi:hypothetical protein